MSLYALGHACTHRRISDVRRYQHSAEGVSDHLSYNAYYAANPGQTNQHTQGIVRAESGYYCRDPLRFSLWDSIGSTLIQQFTASAVLALVVISLSKFDKPTVFPVVYRNSINPLFFRWLIKI